MLDLFHSSNEPQPKTLRKHQASVDDFVSNLLAEGWKRIDGFERYLICNTGVVYSSIRAGRFLSPTILNSGYEYVSLMAVGTSKASKKLVHRLVAEAFCDGFGEVVNHRDGNKRNNHFENLEWCSYAENNDHARDAGLVNNFGSKHYAAKLTADDVLEIRRRAALGEFHRCIASDFGVSRKTVTGIVSGGRWRRVK
ncbi:HNH endonuclease [Phaeobacter gallaeciensis]|uniref:HNH endonuclease n=1 Tax=Phaeobacter gallaeciensis TaxID=60890 RepID=UPI0023801834|nr:HNH endonuclease [Phaeobacter gallaeciensis]MDE4274744.1 HNH endonuclease [Phaeobacter gallaeciensis]MDE4299682.1 HNH endonuclease [Phaeobacter gallaeciensis]MDE5184847.1 HNH endonuclease [Phaeobacter gallaeciensis]